jgi:glutaconate CoA-transferase, subunit A
MAGRRSKLTELSEAAALIPDGARLAPGGQAVYQRPMALTRELVRQGRRDLTVIGVLNGPETDLLAGAGCIAVMETSYVGLEQFGLAPNFRRAVEQGRLRVEDFGEMLAFERFRASGDGATFVATASLHGTDMVATITGATPFACPLTGTQYLAVPPADPDVAVLHVAACDEYGNVVAPRAQLIPQTFDLVVAKSAKRVIVTAEEIVSNAFVRKNPSSTVLPSFRVDAVVHAPWGAYPSHSIGNYRLDEDYFRDYLEASGSDEDFEAFVDARVRPPEAQCLQELGTERMTALRVGLEW